MPVDIDWAPLQRAVSGLAAGLDTSGKAGAQAQAQATAQQIRNRVPRRSGRLASSVGVEPAGSGWAVTYGTDVPYAGYIEKRSHAVQNGVSGADTMFAAAMRTVAANEVARL